MRTLSMSTQVNPGQSRELDHNAPHSLPPRGNLASALAGNPSSASPANVRVAGGAPELADRLDRISAGVRSRPNSVVCLTSLEG